MDPLVLIDSIAECMAYEEKELCQIGNIAIGLVIDVASMPFSILMYIKYADRI